MHPLTDSLMKISTMGISSRRDWLIRIILTSSLLLATNNNMADAVEAFDFMGRRFVFGMQEVYNSKDYDSGSPRHPVVYLASLAKEPVEVTITAPVANNPFTATATVERNTVKPVDLRFGLRCGPDGSVEPKGILIEATDEISVQLINQEMYTTDGTVIFPDDSIGTEYYVSVYSMFSVQIVATEPGDTTVSITLTDGPVFMHSGTFWAGDKVTETLKQYHVWNIIDTFYGGIDISGSHITANKPIGVMAGSYMASVGSGTADHLLEQMLPYNYWGKQFLLPSTPARKIGDIFRACAAVKSVLTMSTGGSATLNPGACKDYDVPTGQNPVLSSDFAIQVYIYTKSYDSDSNAETSGKGDPSLAMVPPISQYINAFMFSTMSGVLDPFEYFGTIAFPIGKGGALYWNRNVVLNMPGAQIVDAPDAGMTVAQFPIEQGTQDVWHQDPTVNFMVWSSALSPWNSYNTIAGARSARVNEPCVPSMPVPGDGIDNDCDGRIDEELEDGLDTDGDGEIDEDTALQRVDGNWGEWSSWSECLCPDMKVNRTRYCDNPPPKNDGEDCPGIGWEEGDCYMPCGTWLEWSPWTECNCNNTNMTRTRECEGNECLGNSLEWEVCIIDCEVWGEWSPWSNCTCPVLIQNRTRECETTDCEGPTHEEMECYEDCQMWGEWSPWSQCTCPLLIQNRTRECEIPDCDGPNQEEQDCFLDCHIPSWGEWSPWTSCGCPDLIQNRTRSCDEGYTCQGKDSEQVDCYLDCYPTTEPTTTTTTTTTTTPTTTTTTTTTTPVPTITQVMIIKEEEDIVLWPLAFLVLLLLLLLLLLLRNKKDKTDKPMVPRDS